MGVAPHHFIIYHLFVLVNVVSDFLFISYLNLELLFATSAFQVLWIAKSSLKSYLDTLMVLKENSICKLSEWLLKIFCFLNFNLNRRLNIVVTVIQSTVLTPFFWNSLLEFSKFNRKRYLFFHTIALVIFWSAQYFYLSIIWKFFNKLFFEYFWWLNEHIQSILFQLFELVFYHLIVTFTNAMR